MIHEFIGSMNESCILPSWFFSLESHVSGKAEVSCYGCDPQPVDGVKSNHEETMPSCSSRASMELRDSQGCPFHRSYYCRIIFKERA